MKYQKQYYFTQSKKKNYFGAIFGSLALSTQIWAKMNFPEKKGLSQFLNIPII